MNASLGRAAERGSTLAVPAHRRLRVHLQLPHRSLDRARRRDRLALRARLRLPERLRQHPRPRSRVLPVRSVQHQSSRSTRLRTGHQRGRHHVEDPGRLGRRARRARRWELATTRIVVTPHTRPPADDDAEHTLVRTVECIDGRVEIELVCEPAFDYGRTPAEWTLVDGGHGAADASADGLTLRLQSDMALGIEGSRVRARHMLEPGDKAYCALSWAHDLAAPADVDDATARIERTVRFWRNWLGRARIPDHRVARSDPTLGAHHQGPHLHADRRHRRRTHDVAARNAGWRTQLGLPLHLDAGHDLHPSGAALLDARLGSRRVHAVHRRHRGDRGRIAPDHVRDRRTSRSHRVHPRRSLRLRGRSPGSNRQRRVRPATERRVRRRAGLDPPPHPPFEPAAPPPVADRRIPGRVRHEGLARARPGHLGSARCTTALRLVEAHVLGRARPGRQPGRDPWRRTAHRAMARDRPGDPRRHPRQRDSPTRVCSASTTRPTRSTPPSCSPRCSASFRPTTTDCAPPSTRSRTDLTENGFVLRYRTDETDDGLSGKEGTFLICSFWLVSALAVIGELQEARDLMERLLRIASPLGLYAEEFDVDTGRHLGNFPQAFSHLALIEAAARIIVPEIIAEMSNRAFSHLAADLGRRANHRAGDDRRDEQSGLSARHTLRRSGRVTSAAASGSDNEFGEADGREPRVSIRLARARRRRARGRPPRPGSPGYPAAPADLLAAGGEAEPSHRRGRARGRPRGAADRVVADRVPGAARPGGDGRDPPRTGGQRAPPGGHEARPPRPPPLHRVRGAPRRRHRPERARPPGRPAARLRRRGRRGDLLRMLPRVRQATRRSSHQKETAREEDRRV